MESTSVASEQLAARGFQLRRDAFGRLVLTDADGQHYEGVEVSRAFPISSPGEWITSATARGTSALHPPPRTIAGRSRQVVEEELANREFVPVIRRLVDV